MIAVERQSNRFGRSIHGLNENWSCGIGGVVVSKLPDNVVPPTRHVLVRKENTTV
jgi:hypothetical protein